MPHPVPEASTWATALGRQHAWWMPSGRAAITAAMSSVGAKRAIVPAFNCWAVMQALAEARVEPVFVDVGSDLNADVDQMLTRIAEASPGSVLLLTHQFGIPVRGSVTVLTAAKERGVPVIEDAAAALGAVSDAGPAGAVGDASILSFQYTKSVFSGEGGILLTSDDPLEPRVSSLMRSFRARTGIESARQWLKLLLLAALTHPGAYEWTIHRALPPDGTSNERGTPATESEFRALPSPWMRRLAGITRLRLTSVLAARRRIARHYLDGLQGLPIEVIPEIATEASAPIRFPLLVPDRSEFIAYCTRHGLDLGRSFAYSCAQPGFVRADRIASSIVNLPLTARLESRVPKIISVVRAAFGLHD